MSGSSLVDVLTARQREVLELLSRGLSNEAIGSALGISRTTARTHVTAILDALDVDNRTEAAAVYVRWRGAAPRVDEVLLRPAIAVLPIFAVDEKRGTRIIAAGLTSDLISLFGRWCWFPVVDVGSSELNLQQTPQQVGQRLGARFVVVGNLRALGEKLRLAVFVTDVESGRHLWNETFEFAPSERNEVEDGICAEIVATIYPLLLSRAGAAGFSSGDPTAWQLAHEGLMLFARRSADANVEAQQVLRRAIEADPHLALAHYGLGLTHYDVVLNQWGGREAGLDALAESAMRCVALAPHAAEGHYLLGRHHQTRGDQPSARRALEEAVGRNPSFGAAHALLGQTLVLTGELDDGLHRMRQAVRLGPTSFGAGLAVVHFVRCEYSDALAAAERLVPTTRGYPFGRAMAVASAWELGDGELARTHLLALKGIAPHFDATRLLAFGPDIDGVARIVRAIEAAGRSLP